MTIELLKAIAYPLAFIIGIGATVGYCIFRINHRHIEYEEKQDEDYKPELDLTEEYYHKN